MNDSPDIRKYLKAELNRRIESNPSYSLRAFARDLGIDHGSLSQVISGRRKITQKNYEKLLASLPLRPKEKAAIEESLNCINSSFSTYDDNEIVALNQWYHPAILELMETDSYQANPDWIAQRLKISIEQVEDSLQMLELLGMIKNTPNGFVSTGTNLATFKGTKMQNLEHAKIVQNVQAQFFDKQKESIHSLPPQIMSHYGLTFAIDPEMLPNFRKKLVGLMREMNEEASGSKKMRKEVYRLNLSLFPLTDCSQYEVKG